MSDALTDTEKFSIIARVYADIYEGYEKFSIKIGAGRSTVHNWEKRETKNINSKAKSEICASFNLLFKIWEDEFTDEVNFEQSLKTYKNIAKPLDKEISIEIESKVLGKRRDLTAAEESTLTSLAENSCIDLSKMDYKKHTSNFLFELAILLKNKKQIKDALAILQHILSSTTTYRYTHHNKIQHLKAVLLSDDTYRKWDEAIHLLRLLYASGYHLQEPEVTTLMASNFKRKALSSSKGWKKKTELDSSQLAESYTLYKEAYALKEDHLKY